MISLAFSDIAAQVGGTLLGGELELRRVSVDTRTLQRGDVYFALTGDQFDGHQFVEDAVARGAAGVVVERECGVLVPQLVVRDARRALGDSAALWCARTTARRIALTGSNGKTTVKEMLRSILTRLGETLATEGNLNNDVGLPLTLFRLTESTEYAVLEMGANHAGEIDRLASLVKPDIAVVNNVGPAHLDGFGSLHGVAAAKGEIYEHLVGPGVAVINLDEFAADDWLARSTGSTVLGFSMRGVGDLQGRIVSDGVLEVSEAGETHTIELPLAGEHNLCNALTAAAVCRGLGVAWADIPLGLAAMHAVPGRLVPQAFGSVHVLDDSYNANPASTLAALKVLAAQRGGRRWCVLGEMAELGDEAGELHGKVGKQAAQLGIECFLSIGRHAVDARRGFGAKGLDFQDQDALIAELVDGVQAGDSVLVKGSRLARMENVVDALRAALSESCA
ncbi:MAG: UDP-N-acetylmuramoyl-tripeptide--D-alanyl-D-alanine ligase [Pseudomonadota bacterium]